MVRTVNYELGDEDGIWFRGDPAPNTRNYFVTIGSDFEPGAPVLVDDAGVLIAGHGRVLAAKALGLEEVPAIRLGHLTEAQARAYRLADNQLALTSTSRTPASR